MRKLACLIALIGICIQLNGHAAYAGPALDQALGAHCGRSTCTISNNPGGDVAIFQQAAREVLSEGKHLRIDGLCASACVVMADLARANTCVTPAAEFGVHEAFVVDVTGQTTVNGQQVPVGRLLRREDPPQSADVDQWIRAHGGYPTDGVNIIPVDSTTTQFWHRCA